MQPKFSLNYIFYNQLDYLKYNLKMHEYIWEQGFRDFELVIGDDGSNDGSLKLMRNIREYPFPIKFFPHKDKGFRAAVLRNRLIEMSEGEYIYISDGDTFVTPDTYRELFKHADPSYGLNGIRYKIEWKSVNQKEYAPENILEAVIKDWDYRVKDEKNPHNLRLKNIPPSEYFAFSAANCLFPAKDIKKILWTPEDWKGFGCDDYYFALSWLGKIKKSIKIINESICYHIEHPNTESPKENYDKLAAHKKEMEPLMGELYS